MSQRLPNQLTPVTPNDILGSFARGWAVVVDPKVAAPRNSLLVLLSQWALETGKGHSMHCYNIGNIKHVDGDGRDFTYFACDEILNGKVVWFYPDDPGCCFRAYTTLDAGVQDYLNLLKKRFNASWPAVLAGDPVAFGHALKQQRYYTANETQYCATLSALFNEFSASLGHYLVVDGQKVAVDLHTVKGQQMALNVLGVEPKLTEDGAAGPATSAAVKWFQRIHGLTVDGVAGPKTIQALGVAVDMFMQES